MEGGDNGECPATNKALLPEGKVDCFSNDEAVEVPPPGCVNQDETITFQTKSGESHRPMIYGISETPPLPLLTMVGFQQCVVEIISPLGISLLAAEVVCAQDDIEIKAQILSATFFMCGLSTILMSTFGVRLPIFQGPGHAYIIPLLAMAAVSEQSCKNTISGQELGVTTNSTNVMANSDNTISMRNVTVDRLAQISGSLLVAGILHFLIGITGSVGLLMRYIGPVTVVPTIVLVGLSIVPITVKFSETSWLLALFTCASNLVLSLFLAKRKTPIPMWSRNKGFYVQWTSFHQMFSMLLSILSGWLLSAILTHVGYFSDDPNNKQYLARTDARSDIIQQSDWFTLPYPGKLSSLSFNTAIFMNHFVATIVSVLDSIGDYITAARTAHAAPVPKYAFNRGIALEGLMSMLSSTMGCCHATVSYGSNIGVMGVTQVASRRVFQVAGILYILFAVIGKLGAVLVSIPNAVLGGAQFVSIGLFIGLIFGYLEKIDLRSTRNLAIIGITLMMGMAMPYWAKKNPNAINTDNSELDQIIVILLSNGSFVGGLFAILTDNLVPGTLEERGLLAQIAEMEQKEGETTHEYLDGPEIYRMPGIPDSLRRSRLARYIPVMDYMGPRHRGKGGFNNRNTNEHVL